MEIKVTRTTNWERVVNAARFTERKAELGKEPSDKFKRNIIRSEHSPIRLLEFDINIMDIPYYAAMHLVRHFVGVEKFVSTQRPDRTGGKDRSELAQDEKVNLLMAANAQAIINISRLRMCSKADKTTRTIWALVVAEIRKQEPILADFCVPNCIAKGYCPEIKPCWFCKTKYYDYQRNQYITRE